MHLQFAGWNIVYIWLTDNNIMTLALDLTHLKCWVPCYIFLLIFLLCIAFVSCVLDFPFLRRLLFWRSVLSRLVGKVFILFSLPFSLCHYITKSHIYSMITHYHDLMSMYLWQINTVVLCTVHVYYISFRKSSVGC